MDLRTHGDAAPDALRARLAAALDAVNEVVLGHGTVVRLALTGLLADGHLLIEDLPGVGKTTLAQTLARVLGLGFRRVQFTSDLLPADLLGGPVLRDGELVFEPGPVFTNVLLADEINRASPRTQSALLEVMEERQVSSEGQTHPLPEPFLVIATQNPYHLAGTHPLPESQLDRFVMRLRLGFPPPEAERRLLLEGPRLHLSARVEPVLDAATIAAARRAVAATHVAAPLLDYVQALLEASRRRHPPGLSPRAGLALLGAARAAAWLRGSPAVTPDDVQNVFVPVTGHRLSGGEEGDHAARELLASVQVP